MSFFQHQKSTDISSIWSVQIEHYFVQIDYDARDPQLSISKKKKQMLAISTHVSIIIVHNLDID
jgi:C4-dicarboxylate transporter